MQLGLRFNKSTKEYSSTKDSFTFSLAFLFNTQVFLVPAKNRFVEFPGRNVVNQQNDSDLLEEEFKLEAVCLVQNPLKLKRKLGQRECLRIE